MPSASFADERIQKKKKQLEMLKKGQEMKTNPSKPGQSLRKRFWKDVKIEDTPGKLPLAFF
ncbi:hypothetical protein FH972_025641 [Carpinus fangiana]|uniref:Uncharacterized protein n=1 Tax=Carpinus fangiana TaxID=176857 RepID=A0A5N6L1Z9_9ROSI|nr:hypothetical protein FH972_025641 [Carpinus fangiana]